MHRLTTFQFDNELIQAYVPDADVIKEHYNSLRSAGQHIAFPFWARVWESSIALCRFLTAHKELLEEKQVLELAAGIGLPSMLAARWAGSVISSDINEDAVKWISQSVHHNNFNNVQCKQLHWSALPVDLVADVVLMSDVNYAANELRQLRVTIQQFLNKGSIIILATPERIVARDFITSLAPFISVHEIISVAAESIHVFVMQGCA